MKKILVPAVAAAVTVAATLPAAGQGQPQRFCAERLKLIAQLETKHGETRKSVGLQQNAGVVETFANADTGSWTIIVSLPNGMSCLVAVGEAWRAERTDVSMLQDPPA